MRRHGITKRVEVNSIANRTLISNETNRRIRDKAPADYIADQTIFPVGVQPGLIEPHFIDGAALSGIRAAAEALTPEKALDVYQRFLQAREAAMIAEIRRACAITAAGAGTSEESIPDEVAEDVQTGAGSAEDETEELEEEALFA